MTIRHLDRLLHPTSLAVIGATDRPSSIGAVVLRKDERSVSGAQQRQTAHGAALKRTVYDAPLKFEPPHSEEEHGDRSFIGS